VYWPLGPHIPDGASYHWITAIPRGGSLEPGQYTLSGGSRYALFMQEDGNLVVYRPDGSPAWASGAIGSDAYQVGVKLDGEVSLTTILGEVVKVLAPARSDRISFGAVGEMRSGDRLSAGEYLTSPDHRYAFLLQTDGNLVLYGPGYEVIRDTNTNGRGGTYLDVQDDGNVVLYRADGSAVWATDTQGLVDPRLALDNNGVLTITSGTATALDPDFDHDGIANDLELHGMRTADGLLARDAKRMPIADFPGLGANPDAGLTSGVAGRLGLTTVREAIAFAVGVLGAGTSQSYNDAVQLLDGINKG
jgi:hypothetical protein